MKTKPKTMTEDVRKLLDELMLKYVENFKMNEDLKTRIKTEQLVLKTNMTDAEVKLLKIANEYKIDFNDKGNFELGEGYLHISKSGNIVLSRKFDAKAFAKKFPTLIDITKAFRLKPITDLLADKNRRKEIKALGVDVTKEEIIEVCVHKGKTEPNQDNAVKP
jgi:hypothetical protein